MYCINEIKRVGFVQWLKRSLGWHIYHLVAKWLPNSFERGGQFAKWFRAICCRQFLTHVGVGANIERNVYFGDTDISIGDNGNLGINCRAHGGFRMGNNVMMGADCIIYTRNHAFDRTDIPMCEQGFQEARPVSIGDDVWIGGRVIILPGVKIGNGVIIGAGSVVTKDIPDYAVAVGNPAVVKKFRK